MIIRTAVLLLLLLDNQQTLKDRRLRGDMIEVYKSLMGKEQIDYEQFLALLKSPVPN